MAISIDSVVRLSSDVQVITGVTNIGIITDFGDEENACEKKQPDVYLVDSAGDSDAGKKIYRVLEQLFPSGFTLKAIICTHSNADHIGGNNWLQQKTGCGIWTSLKERGSVEFPFLEPALVWGGYPFPEISGKLFVAKESTVTRIVAYDEIVTLDNGSKIKFIALPGHYFGMVGVLHVSKNDENVFFLGDSIFGRHVIKKYWIPFLFDVEMFKTTLEKIKDIPACSYVPSHGEIQGEIESLVELNLLAILETEASILAALSVERSAEDLLKYISDLNGIKLADGQFVLIGSTLRSYLSYLQKQGRVVHFIRDNRMLWVCV